MKTKCSVCQGEGKIMAATGDPQHPLQGAPCPACAAKAQLELRVPVFKVGDKVRRKSWVSHNLFAVVQQVRPYAAGVDYWCRLGKMRHLWPEKDLEPAKPHREIFRRGDNS